jgi:hypothetical protein
VTVDALTFEYSLMYKAGDLEENPIGPTEAPVNLIAVAHTTGPALAVVWDYPTKTWKFGADVAAAVLWANPERHRTRQVDRTTAEREALRFATRTLPTEQQLTEICRAARPS